MGWSAVSGSQSPEDGSSYAMSLANQSHDWYRSHAIRARQLYKSSETLLLVLAASIPVTTWGSIAVGSADGSAVAGQAGDRADDLG
jgi:hypothetical protein